MLKDAPLVRVRLCHGQHLYAACIGFPFMVDEVGTRRCGGATDNRAQPVRRAAHRRGLAGLLRRLLAHRGPLGFGATADAKPNRHPGGGSVQVREVRPGRELGRSGSRGCCCGSRARSCCGTPNGSCGHRCSRSHRGSRGSRRFDPPPFPDATTPSARPQVANAAAAHGAKLPRPHGR